MECLIKIKNKTACIVTFLDGKDKKKLSLKNCYEIGQMIAQMHLFTKKMRLYRKNSMNIKNLNPLLNFLTKKLTLLSPHKLWLKDMILQIYL